MSLSQVQIIRSLADALAWFEKELSWNVKPASLSHLTGRIGELYTAMLTRGQMALEVAQRGYDVVSAEGQRISVKTITTSTHADFNKNTLKFADYAIVLRINVIEGEASIEEIFRGNIDEIKDLCNETPISLVYMVNKAPSFPAALDDLAIMASAQIDNRRVIQYENGSIVVDTNGKREQITYPVLMQIAADLGVSPLNSNQNKMNTRQLGAAIIAARSSAGRFAWNDGDVVWHDEDGNEITSRQAKEMQLIQARSQVEEDVAADKEL